MDTSQYLSMFLDESMDNLQTLNEALLNLEQNPNDIEMLNQIFRVAHTINGMAATMGFTAMAELTHKMEDVLSNFREGKLEVSENVVTVLFNCLDTLETMVNNIEAGVDDEVDVTDIVQSLGNIVNGNGKELEVVVEHGEEGEKEDKKIKVELNQYDISIVRQAIKGGFNTLNVQIRLSEETLLKSARAFLIFQELESQGEIIKSKPTIEDIETENFDFDIYFLLVTKKSAQEISDIVENISEVVSVTVEDVDIDIEDLEQEEAAHNEYLQIWKDIFNKISEVHEDYKYAITEYKKLNERYVLDDPKLDIEQSYPVLEIILDETKSLEHLIQSKDFSYAKVVERLKDLLSKSENYEDTLRYFFSKRDELYLIEQRAIDELDSINIVLLEIKSEIKNTHLPSISEKYMEYIDEAYKRANVIQTLRNTLPIQLDNLTLQADEARDIIYRLYENVHNLVITAHMVEETIVYGNRYRSSFLEVNTELTKAELLYRNGEYSEALKIAVDIVEKVQPGFNEKLTKKELKSPTL